MSKVTEIWILTDGRAGNEAQALGLAEAIGRQCSANISQKRIELKPWAGLIPPKMAVRLGARRDGWPFMGLKSGAEDLRWPWPHIVIGAGRRSAAVVAALRKLYGVTAVQLLNPQCDPGAFDVIVVPEHDSIEGANILKTVGAMNRLTVSGVHAAAGTWSESPSHKPQLAVLVGGPSGSATFSDADQKRLLLALESLAQAHSLVVTASRRTPGRFVSLLAECLEGRGMFWSGDGPNPYPAMLATSKAVLVTEDSVNMASEAATVGLPVHIFPLTRVAAKFAAFHEALAARGASRRFTGAISAWAYEPLAEADRIAGDLIRRGLIPASQEPGGLTEAHG
ncbi:MAG: mitochondrial fission ELM1 family protein [Pseudomonadota bacterium]